MKPNNVHIALLDTDYDDASEFYAKKLYFELVEDADQSEQRACTSGRDWKSLVSELGTS